jgi:hypothetical protein
MNEKLLSSVAPNVDSLFMIIVPRKENKWERERERSRLKGKQTHEAIFSMKM